MIDVGGSCLFMCDECQIVCQLDRRLEIAKEHPEYGDFQFDHCSCEKIDGEFFAGGYCEDAWANMPRCEKKGQRRTGRAYRRSMRRRHIQKFQDGYRWIAPYIGPYIKGHWGDDGKWVVGSYIKYPHDSVNKRFFKRASNKAVRRSSAISPKGNGYRKIFDYWWEIT